MIGRLCKNGCKLKCYPARLVCKDCVAAESLARKRARQGEPKKQGRRPKQQDGNIERQLRIQSKPLDGFSQLMNKHAKLKLI
jgi:hypothetical protein